MKSSFREKMWLITFAALQLLLVLHSSDVYQAIKTLLGSMNAVFIGAVLAFVLNVPMKNLEALFDKIPWLQKGKRPLAIGGVLIAALAIIYGILMIVIPTLTVTIQDIIDNVRVNAPSWIAYWQDKGWLSSDMGRQIMDYVSKYANVNRIAEYAPSIFFGLVDNVSGIFSSLLMVIMAFFMTLSMLASKEHLQSITTRILQAFFPKRVVNLLSYIGKVMVDTYDQFLVSQMLEAIIMGTLVFISYSLFHMPYAALAGVLTGILSFIPYIGPFSACAISALFILGKNPWLALGSIILFQVLQLIEGNIIYPRVVGKSVGLPTLFTLAAALIGGSLFGLLGMVFFTPIFAVFYRLIKEWVNFRLKSHGLTKAELAALAEPEEA